MYNLTQEQLCIAEKVVKDINSAKLHEKIIIFDKFLQEMRETCIDAVRYVHSKCKDQFVQSIPYSHAFETGCWPVFIPKDQEFPAFEIGQSVFFDSGRGNRQILGIIHDIRFVMNANNDQSSKCWQYKVILCRPHKNACNQTRLVVNVTEERIKALD